MLAIRFANIVFLWFLVSRSFGSYLFRREDYNNNLPRFSNTSTTQRSPSEDCNTCIIEAPGGISLIFWAPDDANGTSTGNGTSDRPADIPYTQVESGFTL